MAGSVGRAAQIESLIGQSEEMETRFGDWQKESRATPSPEDVRAGQREYQQWYATALSYVSDDQRGDFEDMYEGGVFTNRIRAFLTDPLAINQLYDPSAAPNPFIDKWQNPFASTFYSSHVQQRAILLRSMHAETGVVAILDELTETLRRLPEFLAVVRSYNNDHVPVPSIATERDLQVLVHAILRLLYDDVRAEDLVSQHAGGGSRVDFLLQETGIVIETKMTRPTLTDRQVGAELLVDWGRYRRHPECRGILAIIYDPGRRLTNPAGLEGDLSQTGEDPPTRAIVVW